MSSERTDAPVTCSPHRTYSGAPNLVPPTAHHLPADDVVVTQKLILPPTLHYTMSRDKAPTAELPSLSETGDAAMYWEGPLGRKASDDMSLGGQSGQSSVSVGQVSIGNRSFGGLSFGAHSNLTDPRHNQSEHGTLHTTKFSAFTAPPRSCNRGSFVHGTKFKHYISIMQQGIRAGKSDIFMIDEVRNDGRVPGLLDPPEILIFIDEPKARSANMDFEYDTKNGTWSTRGIDGVIRPWFFQKVLDQRPRSRGSVLFQSKDDPMMICNRVTAKPRRLIHATYWQNVAGIMRDGIVPTRNPVSVHRQIMADLLRGAENHIYAVADDVRSVAGSDDCGDGGHHYTADIVGLEKPPDVLMYIDTERAEKLGYHLEVVQSGDRNETFFITGPVPPELITDLEPNVPLDLPPHLNALIVNPKSFTEISLVDLSADEGTILQGLKHAAEKVGFMQVVGHGISLDLFARHAEMHRRFFSLSADQKAKLCTTSESPVRGWYGKGGEDLEGLLGDGVTSDPTNIQKKNKPRDNKEGFDMNGVPWSNPRESPMGKIFGLQAPMPDELLPGFADTMAEYSNAMFDLATRLLRLLAVLLGKPNFFDKHLTNPVATHRLLHYWPLTDFTSQIGVGEHTDYGLLTLLRQDHVGGLQVLNAKDKKWVHATPITNAIVVNFGDMMARWTGHHFKSTVHRVVNTSSDERFSVPFFLEPNLETVITPGEFWSDSESPLSEEGMAAAGQPLEAETILRSFYTAAGMLSSLDPMP